MIVTLIPRTSADDWYVAVKLTDRAGAVVDSDLGPMPQGQARTLAYLLGGDQTEINTLDLAQTTQ